MSCAQLCSVIGLRAKDCSVIILNPTATHQNLKITAPQVEDLFRPIC